MFIKNLCLEVKQKKIFLKSVGIYGVTNIIGRAIPVFLMPVLTRLLTTFDYGVVTTFNAVRANIEPAISMGTTGAVGRAYYDRHHEGFDFHSYIFNALVVNLVLFFVVTAAFLIIIYFIPGLSEFGIVWLFFIPVYVWASATGSIKAKLWIFQKNPRSFGIYNIFKILCNVSLSLMFVSIFFRSWKGRILGIGLTEIIFCLISLFLFYKYDKLHFSLNFSYIKDILKFGLPMLPHSLGWMLVNTSDRYFLNALEGISVTGVYGVGYVFGSILTILTAPVDLSAAPLIYEKLSSLDDRTAQKMVVYSYLYFAMLIVTAFILWLLAPVLLRLLVDEKFYGAGKYVLWISLGFASHGMFRLLSKYISYSKKTYFFGYITLTAGVVAVVANYTLIKINGPIGAAQATFLAYTTSFLLTWWVANRLYPMPWFSVFRLQRNKKQGI